MKSTPISALRVGRDGAVAIVTLERDEDAPFASIQELLGTRALTRHLGDWAGIELDVWADADDRRRPISELNVLSALFTGALVRGPLVITRRAFTFSQGPGLSDEEQETVLAHLRHWKRRIPC